MARWGGAALDWVDLSTGINQRPYVVPEISAAAWANLPTKSELASLCDVARAAYGASAGVLPVAGAQAAIQMIPRLADLRAEQSQYPIPEVRVLGPTYNEHAASFHSAGWSVDTVEDAEGLEGARVAVVVNPNNPDGRILSRDRLRALAGRVGHLVIDESFADPCPEISMADEASGNVVVLRSFGKFYGLAGLRLGFVLGGQEIVDALAGDAGPWPVSGPAIEVGKAALSDRLWQGETCARLGEDCSRLDGLAERAGWSLVGGGALFRLYDTGDAPAAQMRLAEGRVWSRIFPYSDRWMRLGLPDGAAAWAQVEAVF